MHPQNSSVQNNKGSRLVVTELSCVRNEKLLFHPVSFSIEQGMGIWIKGVNGAGKSSLLRLLAGISSSKMGEIQWQTSHESILSDIHYVGHTDGLRKGLSILENLKLGAALLQQEICDLPETMRVLQLEHCMHTPIQFLSAGQKRRAALARLFVFPRSIWILDEPLTALDFKTQQVMHEKISMHLAKGGLCLLTSHQPLPESLQTLQQLELQPC
jgi:heme exporter protein A